MRDLTRGGLSSAVNEIAAAAGCGMWLKQGDIPVDDGVRAACEVLGLDPLYVANEGRFMAIIAEDDVAKALKILKAHSVDFAPARIGTITEGAGGRVLLETLLGTEIVLDQLSGEQLPRIC